MYMNLFTPQRLVLALFTAAYVLIFGAIFLAQGNYEFLWYVATMIVVILLVGSTLRTSRLSIGVLWLLSIWGLLHMLGGGLLVGDQVLYAQVLYPFHLDGDFTFLKYDQLVHFYGFAVAAIALYEILVRFAPTLGRFGRICFPALASLGLSVLNEVIEFIAVLASPNTGVGGYYNISLDLVANTAGAFVGAMLIEWWRTHRARE